MKQFIFFLCASCFITISATAAAKISCPPQTTGKLTQQLMVSLDSLSISKVTTYDGQKFPPFIYVDSTHICGVPPQGQIQCSTTQASNVLKSGDYHVQYSCNSGQSVELYFEEGNIQISCNKTPSSQGPVAYASGCTLLK